MVSVGESGLRIEKLSSPDLNFAQNRTRDAYDFGADYYSLSYEIGYAMSLRTALDYLILFHELSLKVLSGNKVLVLGSGHNRDALKLLLAGFEVHSVDYSRDMMINNLIPESVAKRFTQTLSDVIDLSEIIASNSIASILIDSCFQHLNHAEVLALLVQAYARLKPGGFVLFRLKLSEDGLAYVVHNKYMGSRYYTSWTIEQIKQLKKDLEHIGYTISAEPGHEATTPHKDEALGVPSFYQLIIRKLV